MTMTSASVLCGAGYALLATTLLLLATNQAGPAQAVSCDKVYRCNDTEANGCVAITNCTQTIFSTGMQVTVDCDRGLPLDERDEGGLDFFAMRWKQALQEDCHIGRLCRYNGDTAATIHVVNGTTFRTTVLSSGEVDKLVECTASANFRFNRCSVTSGIFADYSLDAYTDCVAVAGHHTELALIDYGICLSDCPDITPATTSDDVLSTLRCWKNCAFLTANVDCDVEVTTSTTPVP
ncbi:hypothetical protein PTSG_01494 [Salpingoeca rosetta]|uniref:Uncharacterized protein n=1 Tax=Salpingoeca rosetta (strain ATCC 50818 / BSB-021) TaxID=946362 RepID=F2U0I1_SALR5|nr:uncharacterized protein PTSG_01494 [Salpingoeca rosetta]EGD80909.1 hypothetical protein PTSG_01494 [Salpingoeca rosetta]|eukprot:XP_004997470.1 hypothetical protein PTSG_01494 [Salpingoeca rosetta]